MALPGASHHNPGSPPHVSGGGSGATPSATADPWPEQEQLSLQPGSLLTCEEARGKLVPADWRLARSPRGRRGRLAQKYG